MCPDFSMGGNMDKFRRFFRSMIVLTVMVLVAKMCYSATKLTESNFIILQDRSSEGKILFTTSKDNDFLSLATISSDGTNERIISSAFSFHGEYSSNGTKIYSVDVTFEGYKFYKMNSDGSNKNLIFQLSNEYSIRGEAISPDETKFAYIKENILTGDSALWIINTDGTNNTQLTSASPNNYGDIDFSNDSQWIVFQSSYPYYIYKININNTGLTQLTTDYADAPYWSPDGTKIVYYSNGDIWTMNPDGSNKTNLTNDGYTTVDDYPKWSPDSTKIMWVKYLSSGKSSLWVMSADGSGKKQLTDTSSYNSGLWSKTSDKIAYTDNQNIYTINIDGTNNKKITNNNLPIQNGYCKWSGDYNKIAYIASFPGESRLRTMNSDGSGKYDIVTSTNYIWLLCFAPHSTKILYYDNGDNGYIWSINYDGTGKKQLAQGWAGAQWSPDLSRIAYYLSGLWIDSGIYIMNADGLNQTKIADRSWGSSNVPGFSWSPDGTKLVYCDDTKIWIVSTSSPYPTSLLTDEGKDTKYHTPVFSPDGSKVAYCVLSSGNSYELKIINTNGTGRTSVAEGLIRDQNLKWATNDRIFFTKTETLNRLWSIKFDGTDERVENDMYAYYYDIKPDGTEFIFGFVDVWSCVSFSVLPQPSKGEVKIKYSGEGIDKGYFNPKTGGKVYVNFKAGSDGEVKVKIFSLNGQLVKEISKNVIGDTQDYVEWLGKNIYDEIVASGIYIVKVEGPGLNLMKKICVMK